MRRTISELLIIASCSAVKGFPPGSAATVCSGLTPKDVLTFAKVAGQFWSLPELSKSEQQALMNRYNEIIADIGVENGAASLWWYTWSSCRDRFNSRILADIELLARFQKVCEQGLPNCLVLLCPDPYLASSLVSVAKRNGIKPCISSRDRLQWLGRRVRTKATPFLQGIKVCAAALRNKLRFRKIKISLERVNKAQVRTLLVTWIKAKNLLEGGPPTDTFFGRLPEFIAKENHSVVIFGDVLDTLLPRQERGCIGSVSDVVTMGHFLSTWVIPYAYIRAVLSRISMAAALKSEDPNLLSLVQRDINANRSTIAYCLLFECALRRLVKLFHPTQIIHSCENNPWERVCSRVATMMESKPEVIGYKHSAVLLSYTKIIITEREKPVRPRPKRLICTGARARDIMVRFGGYPTDEIEAGCALRYEYLWRIPPRRMLNRPIQNILVVLEDLPTMPQFVRFIYDGLCGATRIHTTIRPHPSFRYDFYQTILREAGILESEFKTFRVSNQKDIIEDFCRTDLVIYKGSTAAMEAGFLGIPLIHVALPDILTDDPLFEITSLKQVVRAPDELIPAIETFCQMEQEKFLRQHATLRNYIEEYLAAPTPSSARIFLPSPLNGIDAD